MHNFMKLSLSEKGLVFYIDHAMMTQLGGIGSRILIYAKRITEGEYQCTIRESPQGSARIIENSKSQQLPFRIVFAAGRVPKPFDSFPRTPYGMPPVIKTAKGERSREFHFIAKFSELKAGTPVTVPSRRKPQLRQGETVKSFAEIAKPINITVEGNGDRAVAEAVKSQASDAVRSMLIDYSTAVAGQIEVPRDPRHRNPHERFRYALSELNAALCTELNDIELFAERLDENGHTVEKIALPVPSQLRIRGRIIKEETFE